MCKHIKNIGENGVSSDGLIAPRNAQIPHLLKSPKEVTEQTEHRAESQTIKLYFLVARQRPPSQYRELSNLGWIV